MIKCQEMIDSLESIRQHFEHKLEGQTTNYDEANIVNDLLNAKNTVFEILGEKIFNERVQSGSLFDPS